MPPPLKRMPSGNRCKGRGYMLQGQHPRKGGLTAPVGFPVSRGFTPLKTPTKGKPLDSLPQGCRPDTRPTGRRLESRQSSRSGRVTGRQGRESQPCDRSGARAGGSTAAPLLVLTRCQPSFCPPIILDGNSPVCVHKSVTTASLTMLTKHALRHKSALGN